MFQMAPNREYPQLYTANDFKLDLGTNLYQQPVKITTDRTKTLLEFDQAVTLIPTSGGVTVCLWDPSGSLPLHWVVLTEPMTIQPQIYFNCLTWDTAAELILSTAQPQHPKTHPSPREIRLPKYRPTIEVTDLLSLSTSSCPLGDTSDHQTGDFYALFVCLQGEVEISVNHTTYSLERSMSLILPPRTDYRWESTQASTLIQSMWFYAKSVPQEMVQQVAALPESLLQTLAKLQLDATTLTQPYYLDFLMHQVQGVLLYLSAPTLTSYTHESIPKQESYENDLLQQMTTFLKDHIVTHHEVKSEGAILHRSVSGVSG